MNGNFFPMPGVRPAAGRNFLAEEDTARSKGREVSILGFALWERRFGRHSNVVGRVINLVGKSVEVAGVLPRFGLPQSS